MAGKTASDMIKLEDYEEENEGKVIGGWGAEVNIISDVSPCGLDSTLYFGYFSSIGYYYKP